MCAAYVLHHNYGIIVYSFHFFHLLQSCLSPTKCQWKRYKLCKILILENPDVFGVILSVKGVFDQLAFYFYIVLSLTFSIICYLAKHSFLQCLIPART